MPYAQYAYAVKQATHAVTVRQDTNAEDAASTIVLPLAASPPHTANHCMMHMLACMLQALSKSGPLNMCTAQL